MKSVDDPAVADRPCGPGPGGATLSSMQFLADSARDLNSTLELKEVFQTIAQRVHPLIDNHLFCVGLWN